MACKDSSLHLSIIYPELGKVGWCSSATNFSARSGILRRGCMKGPFNNDIVVTTVSGRGRATQDWDAPSVQEP